MKNKVIRIVGYLFLCSVLIAVFVAYYICKKSPYICSHSIIVEHTDDEYFSHLLTKNKMSDTIIGANIFVKILQLFGYKARFGEYNLPDHASLLEAMRIINSGRVVIHKITIPEGFSMVQIIRRLENDASLLGKIEKTPVEGSIMPDTYCFKYPTTKNEIILLAQKEMIEFLKQEWPKRSPKCTLKTPQEALILASIIEKEANIEKEMIAGVYLRRLKAGMRLESCPTAIYAHKRGDRLGHSLKYSELKIKDPYNTYLYAGLPPTPITNPGKSSILAVLHPEETKYLFFVFDGVGKHIFSQTYEEHKKNIAKVRKVNISDVR